MSRKIYKTWCHIISRCTNPKDKDYKHYGERGIRVCDEWANNFKSFEKWAKENGIEENLTLDRIDVNKNYEPTNCRWVDWKTQQRNKRNNHLIFYKGETKCLAEWCEQLGLDYTRTKQRLYKGIPAEKAFNPKPFVRKRNEKGEFEWAEA